jgi:ATP-binding cassette, subfamily B, bacterial CvaB/MchF/RaxB
MSSKNGLIFGFGRKVPMVLQTETAECGLASLAMIAGYFGKSFDLTYLRNEFGSSLRGATLKDLVDVASRLGLTTRPLRLELEELGQLRLPCVLHWDMSHFVVLVQVTKSHIVIHDPAVGIRRLSKRAVSKHFTGVALEVSSSVEFQKAKEPERVRLRQLFGRVLGAGRAIFFLIVVAFAIEILATIAPFYLGLVVDEALVSSDRVLLHILALSFGLLVLLQAALSWFRAWSLMRLRASIDLQAQENLMAHLLNLPVSFFEARHLGDVLSRFGSQKSILDVLTEESIGVLIDGVMAVLLVVVMFLIAPQLALVSILGAVAYACVRIFSYSPLRQAELEAIIWRAKGESHILETLRGIKAVKLHNAQNGRRIQWMNQNVEEMNRTLQIERINIMVRVINTVIVGLLTILIIWLAANQILGGQLTVGLMLAFLAYSGVFLSRLSRLVDATVSIYMLQLHAQRLADIAICPPEKEATIRGNTSEYALKPIDIELRNVFFRYSDSDPYVLRDLNLKVGKGESIAITGPSGCGKSTLLKILCGLLTPTSGKVLIQGIPLEHFGIGTFRQIIGVVLQEDQLFAGSIAENIAFFADDMDQSMVEASASLASIHEEILSWPMRYHTLVGDMGTMLSGGQKQRILLARALYKLPSALLLDEATSSLDVKSEREINSAIKALPMTRIVIAHRPETIRAASRIVYMEDGRIVDR